MINIICMKWGDKYGADYVNALYGMTARHLSHAFRFVCFTDRAENIRAEVECQPLPSLGLPAGIPERGWLKLATFAKDFGNLQGPTLFLDLDVVIVDSLDPLVTLDNPTPQTVHLAFDQKKAKARIGNSSVYRFNIGDHADILQHFVDNFDDIRKEYRNEQAYLSAQLDAKGALAFWPQRWCPSFKYHCIPPFPQNLWATPRIPPEAKVLLFHGYPTPEQAQSGISGKWYRYFKASPWIADYWRP